MEPTFMQVYVAEQLNRERSFRNAADPFEALDATDFYSRFRVPKASFLQLCDLLDENLRRQTKRNKALTVSEQLLIALRFYATGTFYDEIGSRNSVSKSTVCRVVHSVTEALAAHATTFIRLPGSKDEASEVKEQFFARYTMPDVIGAMDCIHLKIMKPSSRAHQFYNLNGYPSINVQAVCDARCQFLDVVAAWPGKASDSFIFDNSKLSNLLQGDKLFGSLLIGDGAYAARRYLLTPYSLIASKEAEYYNYKHAEARKCIQRAFVQLRRRFCCLQNEMRVSPALACKIAIACMMLHNLVKTEHDEEESDMDATDDQNEDQLIEVDDVDMAGRDFRDLYARRLYLSRTNPPTLN